MNIRHLLSAVRLRTLFIVVLIAGLLACGSNSEPGKSSGSQGPAPDVHSAPVQTAERAKPTGPIEPVLAPFDLFPSIANYGFQLRFSAPIAKRGKEREEVPVVNLQPSVQGSFRWVSDSEIAFSPQDPFPAGSAYNLDLKNLVIPEGYTLARTTLGVQFPEPAVQINKCELYETSKDPISKRWHVVLFMNYPLSGYWMGGMARSGLEDLVRQHTKLIRTLGGVEESVPVKVSLLDNSMSIDLSAAEMLRPGKDGSFMFRLEPGLLAHGGKPFPGAECEVKFLDTDWRSELSQNLSDSEAKKGPFPAFPVTFINPNQSGKEPLVLRFVEPKIKYEEIRHKRVAGEILETGVKIQPAIPGQWTVKNDTALEFTPKEFWIPGQTYTVELDSKTFPELILSETSSRVIAPYLSAQFTSVDTGTVPEDPARRVVVTHLSFSAPVEAEKLEKIIRLNVSEKGRVGSSKSAQFSVQRTDDPTVFTVKSEPFQLREYPLLVDFELRGILSSTLGGVPAKNLNLVRKHELPSRLDIFSISGTDLSVAKSTSEELERVLTITTSEDVEESLVRSNLEMILLPDCKEKANKKLCEDGDSFYNEKQVTSEVEKKSETIPLQFVSRSEGPGESTFSFSFQTLGRRQVMVKIAKGLTSKLGFPLARPYRSVMHVKDYPKRLNVMLDGSLLSISGTKRLGILAQNVKRISYRLSRVKASDLHHMIYMTSGDFKKPSLWNSYFTFDDMAQPYEFREELPDAPSGKPTYTSVDFTRFMAPDKDLPRGLFFLEIKEDKKEGEEEEETQSEGEEYSGEGDYSEEGGESQEEARLDRDSRLVLLTDLGLIVKRGLDGSDRVYVASFRKGEPVPGAQVKLIARNGSVLFSAISDKAGEVTFPKASDFTREKQAVVYVAEKEGDLTFLPYEKRDRAVNLSRFDIGGVVNSDEPDALRALLFSDRGIYRPGEKVQLSLTVRRRDFGSLATVLPLTLRITDPQGQAVVKDVVQFPRLGVAEYAWQTSESRTTGTYRAELVIPARGDLPDRELGAVNFRVEEFEPDRLSISALLGPDDNGAFKKIAALKGKVSLKNLFGLPAAGNTVKAGLVLDPWSGTFPGYPGFNFRPQLEYQSRDHLKVELGEQQTSEAGEALFDIKVPDVSGVVLDGIFSAEGFEKESGRSVGTSNRALLTDLEMLVGVQTEDDLSFIDKGALRRVNLQAIDLKGQKVNSGKLKMIVEREEYRNVLVKQTNGVFKYESAKKMMPVTDSELEFGAEGRSIELDTQTPGNFVISFKDAKGILLNQVRFSVMGEGNDTMKINRNANLELVLNKESYLPGESFELSIKAPYAGFGVVTVEREKVLSTTWFRMDGTSSVQTVKVPAGIVGNAYVTVLLARAWDSREIYLPPLSFSSLPLKISESEYVAPPKLDVPKLVKPGENAVIRYQVSEPGAILVYAVDEGILQFAKYRAPEPFKVLLPKRALEVETRTALDMVMPDYSIVQSVLSPSGDSEVDLSKFQNPFKKRNRPPLAFWSGVRTVDKSGAGEYSFVVPDYFDGAVKVFAYFVGEKKVGIQQGRSEIRGDFVIKPNMPTFVAPGDVFDLTVEVTNSMDTEQKTKVSLEADKLDVVGDATQTLVLKPAVGQVAKFRIKAKDDLGEASTRFLAFSGDTPDKQKSRKITEYLSVRPGSPMMRTVKFGAYDPEKPNDTPEKEVKGLREMYPEFRKVSAGISASPGLLIDSLGQFMDGYPYGCSEQLTSKGFIWLLLDSFSENPAVKAKLQKDLDTVFRTLASRMNGSGGIGYWRRADEADAFVTVWAQHLILDAQERGFAAPQWVQDSLKEYLKAKSVENLFALEELFPQIYAIYLRARLGEVVTSELKSLVGRLDAVECKGWQGSAVSWLIGSTYSLLHMNEKAKEYTNIPVTTDFSCLPFPLSNVPLNGGLMAYLKARHFGASLNKDVAFSLLNRLDGTSPDSLSAASMALGMMSSAVEEKANSTMSISGDGKALSLQGNLIHLADVPLGVSQLGYVGPKERHYFYSVVESGFDRKPAGQGSRTQGIALARDVVDSEGKPTSRLKLGETYRVIVRVQSDKVIKDFAVQDLLPAGFEPDLDSLQERRSVGGESNAWACENVDIRDDRLIFFGDISDSVKVFSYPVKPTVRGEFIWPGIYGEAMYNTTQYAWENAQTVVVE